MGVFANAFYKYQHFFSLFEQCNCLIERVLVLVKILAAFTHAVNGDHFQ